MAATILAVAPEQTILASLGFLLEAEGCRVHLLASLPATVSIMEAFDCAIVDCKAVASNSNDLASLQALRTPIILLVDRCKDFPVAETIRVVEKPILGSSLVDAVREVLAGTHPMHFGSTHNPLGV
jgi:DNA-binding response OmpR family regulator